MCIIAVVGSLGIYVDKSLIHAQKPLLFSFTHPPTHSPTHPLRLHVQIHHRILEIALVLYLMSNKNINLKTPQQSQKIVYHL